MPAQNIELRPQVDDRASETLSRVEAAIDKLIPKENIASSGPRPTPVPVSRAKRKRLTVRASKRANRPAKPSRRKGRSRVAPRG